MLKRFSPLALAAFAAACAAPTNTVTQMERGLIAMSSCQFETAEAVYADMVRDQPQNAHAHLNLGVAQHRQGKRDAAIASYEQALALGADEPIVFVVGPCDPARIGALVGRYMDTTVGEQAMRNIALLTS